MAWSEKVGACTLGRVFQCGYHETVKHLKRTVTITPQLRGLTDQRTCIADGVALARKFKRICGHLGSGRLGWYSRSSNGSANLAGNLHIANAAWDLARRRHWA